MKMSLKTQLTRLVVVITVLFARGNASTDESGRGTIDLNALIHQHLLLCGYDYICDISYFPQFESPAPEESYNITGVCPSCYCDDECMSRGDCCPDVYFAVPPMACVNITLLNATGTANNLEPKSPSYEIVNSCPSETASRERHLCEKSYSPKELLTRPPVASTTFPVSYRNKHCAMCNGENDTLNWILDIDCLKFADFNFLSTYQDIIDLARNRNCRMRYSPMDNPVRSCNLTIQPEERFLIRSCNDSGSWKSFDLSIKLACESTYYLKFHEYKNVFCYICNPSTHIISDVIDRCNVTGMWYPYDAGLQQACIYHATSQNTHPFKNIFCYLCNRIANDSETFFDVVTNITEHFGDRIYDEYNVYTIQTGQLRPDYLVYTYTTVYQRTTQTTGITNNPSNLQASHDNAIIVRKKDTELNVTNLVYKQFAVRPFDQFCDKLIVPLQYVLVFFKSCSCYPTCLFRSGDICCLDFALTYPASCLNESVDQHNKIGDDRGILVTDGCWKNRGHPIVKSRCESNHQPDIISFLPLIDKFSNTYYKSFDCFLCNENVDNIFPTDTIENIATAGYYFLTDINIHCNKSLDFGHLVSFMEMINLSRYINCSVRFIMNRGDDPFSQKDPYVKCVDRSKYIGSCNITGNWPVYDPDVAWACENATGNILPFYKNYKNFYCYLCNPQIVVTNVISTCNETGQWLQYNINHEKACHLFPRIYSYQTYKNIFCELCNSANFPNITENMLDDIGGSKGEGGSDDPPPFDKTFRFIFSVTEYDDILPEVDVGRCRKHQLYDYRKDQCRNISCFPGKILNDSSCIPLLTITNNLRYTISIEFTGQLQGSQTNALDFLKSMEIQTYVYIYKLFGKTEYKIDNFHLLANFPCDSQSAYINTKHIKLYRSMTVHIQGYVPRFLTENYLLENTSDMWNVSVENRTIGLVAKTSLRAVMTPTIIDKASFKETCFIQRFSSHTFVPWQTFRSVYVSKVLLCRQIELESDEYDINIVKMELKIHSIGKILPFDKFQRSSHGKVRVCIEDIEAISDPVQEYVDPSLSILTLVCNTASMICLFITFVVYLMNPTLQSIPGINNMCLVFALFFTQLSFQFGLLVPVESIYCEVIGIVSHVLWLSMFGCMNICSFHMFRVFSGIGNYHVVQNKFKTLQKYVTYSFGLPVIIVVLNIAYSLGFSKGQKIGYGVGKCFISGKISFILTFLLPIVLVCLSNIIFFFITAYKIGKAPRVQSNQENHRHFWIYVKLFFITGVSWLGTIIDAFFPVSVVSYFTTVLNGCQGVLIFFGFVVNRRVYMLLKDRYLTASMTRTGSPQNTRSSGIALTSSSSSKD